MPFNILFLDSEYPFKTSLPDAGNKISVKPENGEFVACWKLDKNDTLIHKRIITQMRKRPSGRINICDGLFLFKKGAKTVICLVELKGKDEDHAVIQLNNTRAALYDLLEESLIDQQILRRIEWRAFIKQRETSSSKSNSSPKNRKKRKGNIDQRPNNLDTQFARFRKRKKVSESDFGKFLRS